MRRRTAALVAASVLAAVVGVRLLVALASVTVFGFGLVPAATGTVQPADSAADELAPLRSRVAGLEHKLAARGPRGTYLVIDRANNRLWVRRSGEVMHEAVVSTGSRTVLEEAGGQGRTWTFDTPTGKFRVRSERKDPIWVKPDWAFLEEGQQPPKLTRERVEKGSLGEWALDLGDGYMIHGTLYERLLGRSLTHGCVRVGRDDLRFVARAAGPGTFVYIF